MPRAAYRVREIPRSVAVRGIHRKLGSGEHHRLIRSVNQAAQRRRSVCHRVCTVGDHESDVVRPVVADNYRKLRPVLRHEIRAVQGKGLHRIYAAIRPYP